eukprot:scaffold30147_cov17-Tisochrysis_lutea.AAC.2
MAPDPLPAIYASAAQTAAAAAPSPLTCHDQAHDRCHMSRPSTCHEQAEPHPAGSLAHLRQPLAAPGLPPAQSAQWSMRTRFRVSDPSPRHARANTKLGCRGTRVLCVVTFGHPCTYSALKWHLRTSWAVPGNAGPHDGTDCTSRGMEICKHNCRRCKPHWHWHSSRLSMPASLVQMGNPMGATGW